MQRATVDLPDPDSPTMPSVSPRRICSETDVAAATFSLRLTHPARAYVLVSRSVRRTTGEPIAMARWRGLRLGTEAMSIFVYSCRGVSEKLARGAEFHHLAPAQHRHAIGDLRDDAEVVGDEQHTRPVLALQLADQLQDLRLGRHVERRRRLVGDEKPRVEHQRHRNHDPLPLSAG